MFRRDAEECNVYNNRKYRMYPMLSRIHIQHHNKCCHLYSVYRLCGRDTEKCYVYNNRKHGMYCLRRRFHV